MKHKAYLYNREEADRFIFTSFGKTVIIKAVDFTPTSIKDLYSLSFGDLLPDGSLDDMANSNNGDIAKVLSTVIQIVKDFTIQRPDAKLVFAGSTDERMRLYARILKMYGEDFQKEFIITAFIATNNSYSEVKFETQEAFKYDAFFIKRIN